MTFWKVLPFSMTPQSNIPQQSQKPNIQSLTLTLARWKMIARSKAYQSLLIQFLTPPIHPHLSLEMLKSASSWRMLLLLFLARTLTTEACEYYENRSKQGTYPHASVLHNLTICWRSLSFILPKWLLNCLNPKCNTLEKLFGTMIVRRTVQKLSWIPFPSFHRKMH